MGDRLPKCFLFMNHKGARHSRSIARGKLETLGIPRDVKSDETIVCIIDENGQASE